MIENLPGSELPTSGASIAAGAEAVGVSQASAGALLLTLLLMSP
jgi:hypothetical protein